MRIHMLDVNQTSVSTGLQHALTRFPWTKPHKQNQIAMYEEARETMKDKPSTYSIVGGS